MFSHIGKKIKILACVLTCVGVAASILGGIWLGTNENNEKLTSLGVVVAIAGSLLSWISSFLLYGFGSLVDNAERTTTLLYQISNDLHTISSTDIPRVVEDLEYISNSKNLQHIKQKKTPSPLPFESASYTDAMSKQKQKPITFLDKIQYALSFQTDDDCKSYIEKIYPELSQKEQELISPFFSLSPRLFRQELNELEMTLLLYQ